MKLYATVENEKGKREGIGGNEYLDIDIRVGNKALGAFTVRNSEYGYGVFDANDNLLIALTPSHIKGKKQKGEDEGIWKDDIPPS